MPNFDFDQARAERLREREPISFTLAGETFRCLPFVPLAVMWGLVDAPDLAAITGQSFPEQLRTLAGTVADLLIPEDVDRWWGIFSDRDHPVDGDAVCEVVETLTAVYTGRPTSPSTASSGGRQTNGRASKSTRSRKGSAPSGS